MVVVCYRDRKRSKLTRARTRPCVQMFRPEANRLCKFLEISAMSLSLASRGGEQGKQGYLVSLAPPPDRRRCILTRQRHRLTSRLFPARAQSILSSGASRRKPTGFHPLSWKKRHEPKWFIVRDSYVIATDDPASVSSTLALAVHLESCR